MWGKQSFFRSVNFILSSVNMFVTTNKQIHDHDADWLMHRFQIPRAVLLELRAELGLVLESHSQRINLQVSRFSESLLTDQEYPSLP